MMKETKDGCLLDIEVKPHSKKFEIDGMDPWQDRLIIKIKNSPIEGKANKELLKEMTRLLKTSVNIAKGEKSTKKTLFIEISKTDLKKRLKI